MSETSRVPAELVATFDTRVRAELARMLRESTDAAHALGGAPEVRDERTWHVGRAQGLLDAMRALAPVFGEETPVGSALSAGPPLEWPPVAPATVAQHRRAS